MNCELMGGESGLEKKILAVCSVVTAVTSSTNESKKSLLGFESRIQKSVKVHTIEIESLIVDIYPKAK